LVESFLHATNFEEKKHFSLIVFVGPETLLFIFSSGAPQMTAYSEESIPDGSPSKGWHSTVGWGDCEIRTQDWSFTVWCH
jgi:hypothetical protein